METGLHSSSTQRFKPMLSGKKHNLRKISHRVWPREKCLVQFGWILFVVKHNEKSENGQNFTLFHLNQCYRDMEVFRIHWITYFYIWRYFIQFSRDHDLGQITSGFAHLTHSLGHELNGQSHWLFGPGRGSQKINQHPRTRASWCNTQ